MESIFSGLKLGNFFTLIVILLWFILPVFVFLISKRVKEMRDIAREGRLELKELNSTLKYLKRKFNESDKQQT
jgi:cbb3-type cytochrome oxidase subunit 3